MPTEAESLVAELECEGVELSLRETRVHFHAPEGKLTPARKDLLKRNKAEIIALLRSREDRAVILPQAPLAEATWEPGGHQASMVLDPDVGCVPCICPCPGAFDASAAQRAFDALIARHSLLRSYCTRDENGRLYVVTLPQLSVPVQVVDLRSHEPANHERAIVEMLNSRPGVDPFVAPLLAGIAVRLTDALSVLIAHVHHSICDRASQLIMLSELAELYRSAVTHTAPALERPPMEFRDFVRAHSRWMHSEAAEPHLDYWRGVMTVERSLFELPYDRKVPPQPDALRPDVTGGVPADTLRQLRRIASSNNTSIVVVTSAIIAIALNRWSGRTDAATWICHTGRSRPELYRLVGCFINHWLLRVEIPETLNFNEVVARVNRRFVEATPHLEVTMHRLLSDFHRLTDGLRYPAVVVNVMPSIKPADEPLRQSPPQATLPRYFTRGFSKDSVLALIVNCTEADSGLYWQISHSSWLFEDSTVQRFSDVLGAIAIQVAADPLTAVGTLDVAPIAAPKDSGT